MTLYIYILKVMLAGLVSTIIVVIFSLVSQNFNIYDKYTPTIIIGMSAINSIVLSGIIISTKHYERTSYSIFGALVFVFVSVVSVVVLDTFIDSIDSKIIWLDDLAKGSILTMGIMAWSEFGRLRIHKRNN